MSVSPQLGIDVLHVPAERLAVQLPPQRDAVCNATRRKKKTQKRVETSRERERERGKWKERNGGCERDIY